MRHTRTILIIVICLGVAAFVFLPVYTDRTPMSRDWACLGNLKQLALATAVYQNDYDDRLPTDAWMDQDKAYFKDESLLHDPIWRKEEDKGKYGYAFNSLLLGVDSKKVAAPEKIPEIYDSTSIARNCADPLTSTPNPPRHKEYNNIAYLDGHAKSVKP